MTDTATIRVPRRTRDVLAEQAREQGLSLSSFLAEIARERQAVAIWDSERQASRADAASSAVMTEEQDWEAVSADGFE